jgi:acetoin:2,6-dichlorophenolindophenol oxidoreductase subunit alpha
LKTTAGKPAAESAAPSQPHNGFSLISNEKLVQLYTAMLKCSMLEERIANAKGRAVELSQEAAAVGVCIDLLKEDTLAPSTGGWMQAFVKGLAVESIAAALTGKRGSYAPLNIVPPSLTLGAQLDRAILAGRENRKRRNKKLVAAFCGSCALAEIDGTMRKAAKARLPILLVCHSGAEATEICSTAERYGFAGVVVDGDDAVAVYRVVTEAAAHARRGSGPTLIECKQWPISSRATGEPRTAGNPVLNMERYLRRKGLFSRKLKTTVIADFSRELDKAFKSARPETLKKTTA